MTSMFEELQRAVANGDKAKLVELLAQGADINGKLANGYGLLHWVAHLGDTAGADLLLANGINPNWDMQNDQGTTPLDIAVNQGRKEMVAYLIAKGANFNTKDKPGESTPLHRAAQCAHTEIAELLVLSGANVNARNRDGITPLHCATWRGYASYQTIVKLLLAHDADVNAADKSGRTPLFNAVAAGNKGLLGLLCKHGADIGVTDKAGTNLLLHAASEELLGSINYLIKSGIDINSQDGQGLTVLHWAAARGNRKLIEAVLSQGAKADMQDKKGRTPLHKAAYQGYGGIVEILLEQDGVNINAKDNEGATPLHLVVEKVEYLSAEDTEALNEKVEGIVEEFNARAKGKHKVIALLIAGGADVSAKDKNGNTALGIAIKDKKRDIVMLLKAHGAKG